MFLSFHRCKAGTHPISWQALPAKTRVRCIAAQSSTSITGLQQARDAWGLQYVPGAHKGSKSRPIVLIVDGTNLGCIAAGNAKVHRNSNGNPFRASTQVRFAQWLQFLSAVANSPGAKTYGGSSSTSSSSGVDVDVGGQSVSISHTGPLAAVVVAFDNKGSAMTNVRAQQMPSYLKKRYSGSIDVALAGWSELSSVVDQFDQQYQQQQSGDHHQQHPAAIARNCAEQQPTTALAKCRFFSVNAAYGFEADDVIAAAAQWCSGQLDPSPLVIIASSDSDMQQLMTDSTYWLELQQVASAQAPSGLHLHSAAAFRQQYGFDPAVYPDFLALTGKKVSGVPGIGLSAKLARTLLNRFGSLSGILSSRDALKAYGVAHRLLGTGQPSADATCDRAAANLALLQPRPQQQHLPEQEIGQAYQQTIGSWGPYSQQSAPGQIQQQVHAEQYSCTAAGLEQQRQRADAASAVAISNSCSALHQQQHQQHKAATHLSLLHPARQLHMQQCGVFLGTLQRCLTDLGCKDFRVNWTSPDGLWCDLLVRIPSTQQAASSISSSSTISPALPQQHADVASVLPPEGGGNTSELVTRGPELQSMQSTRKTYRSSAEGWLAFQILGPSDLSAGDTVISHSSCNYEVALEALALSLKASCGSFESGTSALGHPKKSLLKAATGAAQRQLSLLKSLSMPLVVVPFYELMEESGGDRHGDAETQQQQLQGGPAVDCLLKFVNAILQEHCHK